MMNMSVLELMPAEVEAKIENGEEPEWEPAWRSGFVLGTLDFGGFQTVIPTTGSCEIGGEEQPEESCGWTETKGFEGVDGVFSGAAKITLGLTDYPLKQGMSYSLMGGYTIVDAQSILEVETGKAALGVATLELMDASGAINSLIATATALVAALAF